MVVADIVRLEQRYRVAAFLDDVNLDRDEPRFCEAPLHLGRKSLDTLYGEGVRHVILAIGDCAARLRNARLVRERGFSLVTAIHPSSVVASDAHVGQGAVIAAGAVVAPGASIGENVIVNTCASVDHQSVVEDGAHVSVGARLAGNVRIGRAAFVGMGAVVLPKVQVGEHAVIGAGAVVVRDIPAHSTAYGVPARVRAQHGAISE